MGGTGAAGGGVEEQGGGGCKEAETAPKSSGAAAPHAAGEAWRAEGQEERWHSSADPNQDGGVTRSSAASLQKPPVGFTGPKGALSIPR